MWYYRGRCRLSLYDKWLLGRMRWFRHRIRPLNSILAIAIAIANAIANARAMASAIAIAVARAIAISINSQINFAHELAPP